VNTSLREVTLFLENNNFSDQIKEIYIAFQIAIWIIVIIPQSQFFVTEFLFNIYLATYIDGDKTINYESSFVLVKQHSIFSFYINRYSKLLPPSPSNLFIKFLMLFLICVRRNVYNCISPFRHHSKRTIVDQDQNIHFHRKNKPWNKNLLQRAIIIRIFIIKLSNYKHE
jgi:hypothetical protein